MNTKGFTHRILPGKADMLYFVLKEDNMRESHAPFPDTMTG